MPHTGTQHPYLPVYFRLVRIAFELTFTLSTRQAKRLHALEDNPLYSAIWYLIVSRVVIPETID